MHKYEWDSATGGILLLPQQEKSSREPRPVYYREMNLLGMNKRWKYPQNDDAPIMWAEAEKYIYQGRVIARAKGGFLYTLPTIIYTEGGRRYCSWGRINTSKYSSNGRAQSRDYR